MELELDYITQIRQIYGQNVQLGQIEELGDAEGPAAKGGIGEIALALLVAAGAVKPVALPESAVVRHAGAVIIDGQVTTDPLMGLLGSGAAHRVVGLRLDDGRQPQVAAGGQPVEVVSDTKSTCWWFRVPAHGWLEVRTTAGGFFLGRGGRVVVAAEQTAEQAAAQAVQSIHISPILTPLDEFVRAGTPAWVVEIVGTAYRLADATYAQVAAAALILRHTRQDDPVGQLAALISGCTPPPDPVHVWFSTLAGHLLRDIHDVAVAEASQLTDLLESLDADRELGGTAWWGQFIDACVRRDALEGVCGLLATRGSEGALRQSLELVDLEYSSFAQSGDMVLAPDQRLIELARSEPLSWWGQFGESEVP